jgi:hypothetical protein
MMLTDSCSSSGCQSMFCAAKNFMTPHILCSPRIDPPASPVQGQARCSCRCGLVGGESEKERHRDILVYGCPVDTLAIAQETPVLPLALGSVL